MALPFSSILAACLALVLLPVSLVVAGAPGTPAQHPFVFKHSFQGPYVGNSIPFWNLGAGAAVESGDRVRLTPARQSRTGFIWNSVPSQLVAWEVTLQFQVTGQPRFGGDGFAFWYVERPEQLGPVYGSADYFTGLAIAFDTFDNDGRGGQTVVATFNDGTQRYDHNSDGQSQALASCAQELRNPAAPMYARITYQDARLTLELANSLTDPTTGVRVPTAFQLCFAVENLELGADKFFGVTAQTGDVADNHDIFSLVTRDLAAQTTLSLDQVRQRYAERLRESQAQAQARVSAALSPEEFQGEVLSLLRQLQAAQAVVEQSQIAIGDLLTRVINDGAVGAVGSGSGTGGSGSGGPLFDAATQQLLQGLNTKLDRLNQPGVVGGSPTGSSNSLADISAVRNELNRVREELFQRMQNNLRALDNTARNDKAELLQAIRQISSDLAEANMNGGGGGGSGLGGWFSLILSLVTCGGVVYSLWRQASAARNDRFKKFLD